MTTIVMKQLGNGQLANSIGDLYTVPAVTTALIKSITLVNTNTSAETVNLYVLKASGAARRIIPKATILGAGYMLEYDSVITLEAGDKLQGDTTTASRVDFVISGVQEA